MKSNLRAVNAAISGALKRKNEAAATTVEGNVKRRTPVDSGRLRASITHDSGEHGFVVGTNVTYAGFVELGTRYQSPQPYLVPGLMDSVPDLRRIYGG